MGIAETVALVFGITGFVTGVLSLVISWSTLDTNKELATSAAASARAAEESARHQAAVYEESKTAKLVRLDEWSFGMSAPQRQDISLVVFNEGPAVARHIQMFIAAPRTGEAISEPRELRTPRSDPRDALYPFERAELTVSIFRSYYDEIDPNWRNGWQAQELDHLNCWISYFDGHGRKELRYWLIPKGPWVSGWLDEIETPTEWP
jgi:hypothetical protein